MDHHKAFTNVLQEIRGLLAYHRSLGISYYQRTPAMDRLLDLRPRPLAGPTDAGKQPTAGLHNSAEPVHHVPVPSMPMTDLQAALGECRRCQLHAGRQRVVLGRGRDSAPLLLLVGDSPAEEDERSGEAFSGPAGELLGKMLASIRRSSTEVFATNLVKCRPPGHRPPSPEEITSCLPYLLQEIAAAAPRIICAMGPLATRILLKTEESFFRLRGRFLDLPSPSNAKIVVMPTFHPGFLIKNPEMKKASWQDLQLIAKELVKNI